MKRERVRENHRFVHEIKEIMLNYCGYNCDHVNQICDPSIYFINAIILNLDKIDDKFKIKDKDYNWYWISKDFFIQYFGNVFQLFNEK